MKYFKSESGEVFAYEVDGSQDAYIRGCLVPMTVAEVAVHLASHVPAPETVRQAEILDELAAIDAASARPLRAILVGSATDEDRARLTELDEQAAARRVELAALESPPAV